MDDHEQYEQLKAVIAAYGAVPGRWPEAERRALMGAIDDPRLAAALAEARALDAALDTAQPVVMAAGLASRILAAADKTSQDSSDRIAELPLRRAATPARRWGFGAMPEVAVLAASLLIGVWVGGSGLVGTAIGEVETALLTETVGEDELNLYDALSGVSVAEFEETL